MGKEEVTVLADKGKKRAQRTDNEESTATQISGDIYTKVIAHEEAESKRRDADEDAKLYIDTCKEISQILIEIANLKLNGGTEATEKIREKQIVVTTKIIHLKKLNRLEKVRTNDYRVVLQKYREQVDNDHLQLQNLVYEQLHLSKEVRKCYEFKSVDEDMDLISVDEFYASAPEDISKPETTKTSDHDLKLARLTWELMQRKDLSMQIKQLEESKKKYIKDISEKKEQLNSLEPNLQLILEAAKPLQNTLNINVEKHIKMNKLAVLLPKPLYILYVQTDALSRICKWLSVSICGKPEEVRPQEQHLDDISSDSDSDQDAPSRRRKMTQERRRSGTAVVEQRREECLRKHPLTVHVTITLPNVTTTIQFQWLTTLEVICALTSVSLVGNGGSALPDVLSPNMIFSILFPGDNGETCPNPSSFFHLKRAGIECLPTSNGTLGIAYKWAQDICGLKFLSEEPTVDVDTCRKYLENTLQAIKLRLQSRMGLAKEINLLGSGECLRDKNYQATISTFTSVFPADMQNASTFMKLFDSGLVDSFFLFYRLNASINDVKLTAYIAVSPSYPSLLPIFMLDITHMKSYTASNCQHVRDIEREVNTVCDVSDNTNELLIRQVGKLLRCFEVFAATELKCEKPVKAALFRAHRGRPRSHPYRYVETAGGIFTHE